LDPKPGRAVNVFRNRNKHGFFVRKTVPLTPPPTLLHPGSVEGIKSGELIGAVSNLTDWIPELYQHSTRLNSAAGLKWLILGSGNTNTNRGKSAGEGMSTTYVPTVSIYFFLNRALRYVGNVMVRSR
jgi:hypothetical protein